ncbi:jg14285 [Pararge aegeria aegeria]|uniref:Jg14285 protein n=1 Tax=Pararge aegeria aegeria TaxID=348720 RepID=A0A8S4RQD4_9NEOP|nr:jg14285 [Pararge aegeria aegeria]
MTSSAAKSSTTTIMLRLNNLTDSLIICHILIKVIITTGTSDIGYISFGGICAACILRLYEEVAGSIGHLVKDLPTLRFPVRGRHSSIWDPKAHRFPELCAPPIDTSASKLIELCL